MREDLQAAYGSLGRAQRLSYRDHLEEVEPLLHSVETVQVLAPGWWGGHRCLFVVTASRLLLVHRGATGSTAGHAVFVLRELTHLTVHPTTPTGARFRVAAGARLEDITVDRHSADLEQALRLAMP